MVAPAVIAIGEALVEIMRTGVGQPLHLPGPFEGPFPSGAPAVFADCAARLGADTGFIGAVGADEFGLCFLERLARDGVDVTHVRRVADRPTGIAFVAYDSAGGRHYLFHILTDAPVCIDSSQVDPAYFRRARFLFVNGGTLTFGPRNVAACLAAIAAAHDAGARVVFDVNLRTELLGRRSVHVGMRRVARLADIVLPSAGEAERLTGLSDPDAACTALLDWGATLVVAKHGPAGCVIHLPGRRQAVPGFAVHEIDPTGAGDCFAAGLVYALLAGADHLEAARFANAAGALAVTRRGPMEGAPHRAEVDELLRSRVPA